MNFVFFLNVISYCLNLVNNYIITKFSLLSLLKSKCEVLNMHFMMLNLLIKPKALFRDLLQLCIKLITVFNMKIPSQIDDLEYKRAWRHINLNNKI